MVEPLDFSQISDEMLLDVLHDSKAAIEGGNNTKEFRDIREAALDEFKLRREN